MMRKFTVCLVLCATGLFVSSCNDDVSSPPKSALAVDKTNGLSSNTEFTFTIDQVPGAGTVSLLPYGTENLSLGGINIPAASFTGGKATVKFTYAQVGKFLAVVVTNNHSADGKSVKNSYSNTIEITVTSHHNRIADFSFDKISTKTIYDTATTTKIITVEVPYKTALTALKATFTNDAFSTVTVGSTTQTSGTTANDFTNDVTYTVTAANGTDKTDYIVHVDVTPSNNAFSFKSFGGKEVSTGATSTLGAALATSGTDLILYDVMGTPSTSFDSVSFNYVLDNPFGVVHYGSEVAPLSQDRRFDLTTSKPISVMAQDSATTGAHTFDIHAVEAPLLTLTSNDPTTIDVNTGFVILIKALKGTVIDSQLDLTFNIDVPSGVSVTSMTFTDIAHSGGVTMHDGDDITIDFSDAVTIVLHVTDSNLGGLMYDVTYTAGLTELK